MATAINTNGQLVVIPTGHFDYEDVHNRIITLLGLLQAADMEMINKDIIYATCAMIKDLLPTTDEFLLLEKHCRAK